MANKQYQKIFKRSVADRLRNELKSGRSLKDYFEDKYVVSEGDLLVSTIEVKGKTPTLAVPKKDPVSADLENAIILHEYFSSLDETQASDPRLWIYLGHVEFRKYSMKRWGVKGLYEDYKNDVERQKIINQLLDHWFVSGNDRDLRRHALSRLWWAAHLTYAPWEKDSEFFYDLKHDDPYYFTKILLLTQDIYQQVLERSMGRSNRILISILEYLGENIDFAKDREKVRNLMKELSLVYGTKKIIALDRQSLKLLIYDIGSNLV